MTIKGRLFYASTQQPLSNSEIAFYGDDATSSKSQTENTIKLKSSTTNSDGSFTIKTNASTRGRYYLWAKKGNGLSTVYVNGNRLRIIAEDNSTVEIGDVYGVW